MVRRTSLMSTRKWPVLLLALATVTGCAAWRPRFLGGTLVGPRVAVPHGAIPMGQFVRGEVALQHNDIDAAVDAFEKAVAADPNAPMIRLRLATLYVRTGKLDKARAQCEQVIAVEPNNMDAMALYAGIVTALG